MAEGNFISYLRVSTAKQGVSGLGLEAQRKAVEDYLDGGRWKLRAEFVEIESGKRDDRPELANALKACRAYKAMLVIAKLDRLSRDAHFLLGLQKAGVKFVAVDIPEANEMVVGIMAVFAQAERKMISDRTKAALAAAKARGKVLGGNRGYTPTNADRAAAAAARKAAAEVMASDLRPVIEQIRSTGITSLNGVARELEARNVPSAKGGKWTPAQVARIERRLRIRP